ncbi:hypothetical protein evm_004645 [Chilo suppressalis]|nr:hypothetical protein evm_004645 [Chilo suppressalis]
MDPRPASCLARMSSNTSKIAAGVLRLAQNPDSLDGRILVKLTYSLLPTLKNAVALWECQVRYRRDDHPDDSVSVEICEINMALRTPPIVNLNGGNVSKSYGYLGTYQGYENELLILKCEADGDYSPVILINQRGENLCDGSCCTSNSDKSLEYRYKLTLKDNGETLYCCYENTKDSPPTTELKLEVNSAAMLTEKKTPESDNTVLVVCGCVSTISLCIMALSLCFGFCRRYKGTQRRSAICRSIPERFLGETNGGLQVEPNDVYYTIDNSDEYYSYVIVDRRKPDDHGIPLQTSVQLGGLI